MLFTKQVHSPRSGYGIPLNHNRWRLRAGPPLVLVDGQVSVPHGQAEQSQRRAIDPALSAFRAIRAIPRAIGLLAGKEQAFHPGAPFPGRITAPFDHALGIIVGAVKEPGGLPDRRRSPEPILV